MCDCIDMAYSEGQISSDKGQVMGGMDLGGREGVSTEG